MKKIRYLIATLLLMLVSTISFASTITYYAAGSSDSAKLKKVKYVNTIDKGRRTRNVFIPFKIESNWTVNSAKLWIRAVDDYRGGRGCKGNKCKDGKKGGIDLYERARITKIEGQKGKWALINVNTDQWQELLDVTTFLANDTDNLFRAKVKATPRRDFRYKNAKLVIDYDINVPAPATGSPLPPPPIEPGAPVPLPSAIWLFGTALLGLTGLRRKPAASGIA